MALIERFEDIRGWQEARVLTRQIYGLTRTGLLSKDFGLRDQIQRASISVMANIAEGFDCDFHKKFAAFWGLPAALPWKYSPYSTSAWTHNTFPKAYWKNKVSEWIVVNCSQERGEQWN
ncbi:MAG: four helix bundle protein [Caldilineaceae bacterium]